MDKKKQIYEWEFLRDHIYKTAVLIGKEKNIEEAMFKLGGLHTTCCNNIEELKKVE
jgi:hypothetical protein